MTSALSSSPCKASQRGDSGKSSTTIANITSPTTPKQKKSGRHPNSGITKTVSNAPSGGEKLPINPIQPANRPRFEEGCIRTANHKQQAKHRLNLLLARIRANLRRTTLPTKSSDYALEQFGDLSINMLTKEVFIKDAPITLRNREYEILELLAKNRGSLVTKKRNLEYRLENRQSKKASVVDVHIHNLRKSLENNSDYRLITTEYGQGYRLEASPKKA